MAIVKMSEFNLFALDKDRNQLLKELQKFKYVHFKSLTEKKDGETYEELKVLEESEKLSELTETINQLKWMIEYLEPHTSKVSGIKAMKQGLENIKFEELQSRIEGFDYKSIYHELREISLGTEGNRQEIQSKESRINELLPWISIKEPIRDLKELSKVNSVTGTIPKKTFSEVQEALGQLEGTYLEVIKEEGSLIYVLVLERPEEHKQSVEILRKHGFSNVNIGTEHVVSEEIEKLKEEIENSKKSVEKLQEQILDYTKYLQDIKIAYEYYQNERLQKSVTENFLSTENVNVIEGYLPTEKVDNLTKILQDSFGNAFYMETKPAQKDDPDVPIILKNNKFISAFEDITSMYALPRYNEIDPTPFLAPFYWVFFGMMVADLGYGAVMLLATFFALKTFNLSVKQRKFITFFFYLSFTVIGWGIVYGSAFGFDLPWRIFTPAKDYQSLLILSVIFGLFHLALSLAMKAYMDIRDGKPLDALYDVGFWYMALGGGIILILNIVVPNLDPMVAEIAKWVMIVGMVGIVLTGGRKEKGVGAKFGWGVYALYGISGYIGDVVSYSRLMALGLSGGFIAVAVNMIVGMLFDLGIPGYIFGVFVFLLGQAFNIFLSFLSAYVHTLRLTYVESFSKYYEGGGKAFKVFRNDAKYINLK